MLILCTCYKNIHMETVMRWKSVQTNAFSKSREAGESRIEFDVLLNRWYGEVTYGGSQQAMR